MSSVKTAKTGPNTAATASPPCLSAEIVAQNEDIRNEILLRLPIKSLMRFKSVSRPWFSHITSPYFASSQAAFRNRSISGLIVRRPSATCICGFPEFDYVNLGGSAESSAISSSTPFTDGRLIFPNDGKKSPIGILQSSNGLLLCTKILKNSYFNTPASPRECYIYNPATGQCTVLPPNISPSARVLGFSMAFDPSKSPYYEIVCVYNNNIKDPDQHCIEIYSSETRRWRLSSCSPFRKEQSSFRFDGGVYWNRAIHWISMQGVLLYFKLDEERIGETQLFPRIQDTTPIPFLCKRYRYFGESNGHLHLIDHVENINSPWFDVYEMAEDYSRWFVKFHVDLSGFPGRIWRDSLLLCVLCVVRCEPEEESYVVMHTPDAVVRYSFKTKAFDKIDDVGARGGDVNWNSMLVLLPEIGVWPDDAFQYVETLASV